jgi:hypothetical protein
MESFNKRKKELRRLERQRDKAAKRKEISTRKAAETAGACDPTADLAATD